MKKIIVLLSALLFAGVVSSEVKHITTSDGVVLHVTVKGQGIPCLYLHGGPGSGSHWLEKFMGDSLEQYFQMIYLDQRGVARSGSPADGNYSMARMVQDFEEVRLALGIDQWLTMGHSFGGLLQMGYVLEHPGSIKGMLMINAALDMTECFESSWCPKALEFLALEGNDLCHDTEKPLIEKWMFLIQELNEQGLFWKMGYAEEQNMHTMNATFGEIADWNWEMGSVAMDFDDYYRNFKPYTAGITTPVLFYYGKSDWMIGPKHYIGADFPNLLLWGSDSGHMPFMESQEDLMIALRAFVKRFSIK
jgi:proline iminopeptidase